MKILVVVPLFALGVAVALAGSAPASEGPGGGLRFDWTVTLGQLVSAILLTAGVVAGYTRLMARLSALEVKVNAMWDMFVNRRREGD